VAVATYRLQFRPGFGFREGAEVLPYLARLGISHVYASPVFAARPGSGHGYDVCDPLRLNPELGTEADFEQLLHRARELGLGWIQDIVPNHMAVSGSNPMLVDLLENGPASRYHHFFDIDWTHPYAELAGRMLAPFLGGLYGRTLEAGEIRLGFDALGFYVTYYDLRLPLRVGSYDRILEPGLDLLRGRLGERNPDLVSLTGLLQTVKALKTAETDARYEQIFFLKRALFELHEKSAIIREHILSNIKRLNGTDREGGAERFDGLDELLSEQFFRLAFWKVAGEEINYRRFFSINELVSLRVERDEVFEHTHGLILSRVRRGDFSGLRVDHVDGLYDPTGYLRRLRDRVGTALVVVEKILTDDEELPRFWPVQGTTGYDFMNLVCGVLVHAGNEDRFSRIYARYRGTGNVLSRLVPARKRFILENHMAGDVDNMARLIREVSSRDRHARDITFISLRRAMAEVLVRFPVYRTYVGPDGIRDEDLARIRTALAGARRAQPDLGRELDFLERFLLLEYGEHLPPEDRERWVQFVMRFQQVTGPLMAKGVEDSVCYVYNRLLCLNEVGGDPARFGISVEHWHETMAARQKRFPLTMNATATHDHKRGEDVRMRLVALSGLPQEWNAVLKRIGRINAGRRIRVGGERCPDRNDEYFLYQTLLGSWPAAGMEVADYPERIKAYLSKSVREAKEHSTWLQPDAAYEAGFLRFAEALTGPRGGAFAREFVPLRDRVVRAGMTDSLAQVVLKICSPGVPDFYQGTELWDLSLVDPDNRRAVDFGRRRNILERISAEGDGDPGELIRELLDNPEDGAIKLYVLYRTLQVRRRDPDLFLRGDYLPLHFSGERAGNLLGFVRKRGARQVVVVVPRLTSGVTRTFPAGRFWRGTTVADFGGVRPELVDGLTGRVHARSGELHVEDVLSLLPVAVLEGGV
jgi:(1->4)-alpha-D-glucan 1-alpha-D-glucosylmutase